MNPQILQLAASHFPRDNEGNIQVTPETIAEFAVAIAKECAKVARNTDLEDVEGGDSAVLYAASEAIKNYFGVK